MPLKSTKTIKDDIQTGTKINVFGVGVDDISSQDALWQIIKLAKGVKRGSLAVTVNSEFVMLARRNPKFKEILKSAQLALADGSGVVLAKRILGGKFQNRVTGIDLVEKICAKGAENAVRVGFLGGFDDVAERVASRQKGKNPGLEIAFVESGAPTIGFDLRLRKAINGVGGVDVLFVAFGMGQQEFWIERNRKLSDVGVFIGVGGAFDYLSGVKKRAPIFMQNFGFEWLWRLVMEPGRFWRMFRASPFWFLVFREMLVRGL